MNKKTPAVLPPNLLTGKRVSFQSQIPYAPWVSSLPLATDPQSDDGSMVVLNSGGASDGLYGYDTRTQPGKWTKITSISGIAPTSGYQLLNNDTTRTLVNSATTGDQNLTFYNIPAGLLNTIGKTIRVTCKGVFNTGINGTVFGIRIRIGGVLVVNLAPATTPTLTAVNLGWRVIAEFTTNVIGAAGGLEVGTWSIASPGPTAGVDCEVKMDATDSNSSAIDLTIAQVLQVQANFSTSSTANVAVQRLLMVEALN